MFNSNTFFEMTIPLKTFLSSKIQQIGLPILALCWVSIVWGTTWVASKEGVQHMPALQLAGMRQFLGGLLYILFFTYKKAPWPKGKQWKMIVILSILNFVLSNGLSTWGVKYISSGLGAIIGACVPLWILIINISRGQKATALAITGFVVSFSGVCVIFYDHLADFLNPDFSFGIIISIISTITWAFGSLYTKKKAADFNPYFGLGIQMFISSLLLFAFVGATGTGVNVLKIPAISWLSIAYLVVFGSILTFIAFIYALQHLPPDVNSIYAYINPIVAVLLGAVLFDEKLTVALAIGGFVTLVGIYIVNRSMKKNASF